MFGKCSHAAFCWKYFLQLLSSKQELQGDTETVTEQKDGAYAKCDICTVSFSFLVSGCFRPQAKRFLEKKVSSYNSPSSV